MIDVTYKKKFLSVNQIWYGKDISIAELLKQKRSADILFVHGADKEETKGAFRGWQEYHTCINDLRLSEEDMLSKINKNVRYEIRRSQRDGIAFSFYQKKEIEENASLLKTFSDIYERMYLSKGSATKLNINAINHYLENDNIIFSAVMREGEILVFHSYIYEGTQTRLLHSASCFREESADQAMIGRVNKRLHWEDIKYFKNAGVVEYDWGGISDFDNPNGIDEFKLKFGGEKITYYNIFAGNTVLGKLAVTVMKLLKRVQ